MQEQDMARIMVDAVSDTFQTTFNGFPEIIYFDNFNEMEEECVISSIGFNGSLEGTCAVCLPDSSACSLVSRMVGHEVTEVTADIIDGIGEIVNIILGSIKMKLQGQQELNISVPSCIKGSRMVILSDIKKTVTINKSFKFENAVFVVSLMYKEKPKGDDAAAKKLKALEMLKRLGK
jgi:chemotaxis protein CheX